MAATPPPGIYVTAAPASTMSTNSVSAVQRATLYDGLLPAGESDTAGALCLNLSRLTVALVLYRKRCGTTAIYYGRQNATHKRTEGGQSWIGPLLLSGALDRCGLARAEYRPSHGTLMLVHFNSFGADAPPTSLDMPGRPYYNSGTVQDLGWSFCATLLFQTVWPESELSSAQTLATFDAASGTGCIAYHACASALLQAAKPGPATQSAALNDATFPWLDTV